VDTVTKPVLRIVQPGRLDAKKLVSHRFEVSEIMGVRHLRERRKERALKAVLKNANANGRA
jgi:threonine dehydrogenase-like Zn-dependent dehydrogenase